MKAVVTAPLERAAPPRWLLWIAAATGIVILTWGTAALVVVARGDAGGAATVTMQPIAAVVGACDQWQHHAGRTSMAAHSCADMGAWMAHEVRAGNIDGPMMWGDADRVREACEGWMADGTAAHRPRSGTCGDMALWMRDHVGDWQEWLHDGRMTAP